MFVRKGGEMLKKIGIAYGGKGIGVPIMGLVVLGAMLFFVGRKIK